MTTTTPAPYLAALDPETRAFVLREFVDLLDLGVRVWRGPLAELLASNEELVDELPALVRDGRAIVGGGASPLYEIAISTALPN